MKAQRFYWKSSKKGNSNTFVEFIHPVAIGINGILSRKLIWHWMNDLLNNPLNTGTGKWSELLINILPGIRSISLTGNPV